jgi:hypothetical protein
MCAGDGIGGEDFAIGGAAAVEIGAVPGRLPHIGITLRVFPGGVDLSADGIGFADEVASAALGRVRIAGDAWRHGDAVFLGGESGALHLGAQIAATARTGGNHRRDQSRQNHETNGILPLVGRYRMHETQTLLPDQSSQSLRPLPPEGLSMVATGLICFKLRRIRKAIQTPAIATGNHIKISLYP